MRQKPEEGKPRDHWDFKFKGFVIGAWWGPDATDAEIKLYKEAGFNVVMAGRYMQLDDYADAERGIKELDLARKYGLGVMFDPYTKNERPWGGKVGPVDPHPTHHPASLIELQWLYEKVGKHPALIGFMIGDDQGEVSKRSADCTKFLHEQRKPHLMPWLCGWISAQNLATHNNPIENPQIYPTLYNWNLTAEEMARSYVVSYARVSRENRDQGFLFCPMFNVSHDTHGKTSADAFGYCPSDSLVGHPAYLAQAYGAEGIWYFTYNGGVIQRLLRRIPHGSGSPQRTDPALLGCEEGEPPHRWLGFASAGALLDRVVRDGVWRRGYRTFPERSNRLPDCGSPCASGNWKTNRSYG